MISSSFCDSYKLTWLGACKPHSMISVVDVKDGWISLLRYVLADSLPVNLSQLLNQTISKLTF